MRNLHLKEKGKSTINCFQHWTYFQRYIFLRDPFQYPKEQNHLNFASLRIECVSSSSKLTSPQIGPLLEKVWINNRIMSSCLYTLHDNSWTHFKCNEKKMNEFISTQFPNAPKTNDKIIVNHLIKEYYKILTEFLITIMYNHDYSSQWIGLTIWGDNALLVGQSQVVDQNTV